MKWSEFVEELEILGESVESFFCGVLTIKERNLLYQIKQQSGIKIKGIEFIKECFHWVEIQSIVIKALNNLKLSQIKKLKKQKEIVFNILRNTEYYLLERIGNEFEKQGVNDGF